MRWNESTSAHSTGSTTITKTTMTVGETSAMPARESRRARVFRARRRLTAWAWTSTSAATVSLQPGLDLLDGGLQLLRRLRRVLAADDVGDRGRDRVLAAQRADERALALREAPALEVLDAVGQRLDRVLRVELAQRSLGIHAALELG